MEAPKSVEVGKYEAELRDLDLSIGLRVHSVRLHGVSLQLLTDPIRVLAPTPGKVEIVVLESAITDMLSANPPLELKNISVRIAEGKLRLEAVKKVVLDFKVKAVCTLRIENESAIFVDLESIDVVGASLKNFAQTYLDKLNPIIDAKMLPIPAKFHRLEMVDGRISVWGEISPPE